MNEKMTAAVIGVIGAVMTLGAYSQSMVSPSSCIGAALCVLMYGLLVGEGFIPNPLETNSIDSATTSSVVKPKAN
ncbi:unnamed protein product [Linum tenue]|uniref:Uncharacterized protein n=1 Tax=Linum tenue TaxID=586396 RepID=A0AAV0N6C8_9ROSI|nr:unnamed protein product [Linum tenue]